MLGAGGVPDGGAVVASGLDPDPGDGAADRSPAVAGSGLGLGCVGVIEAAAKRGAWSPPFAATNAIEPMAQTTVKAAARSTAGVSGRRAGGRLGASTPPPLPRLAGDSSTFSVWLWRSGRC